MLRRIAAIGAVVLVIVAAPLPSASGDPLVEVHPGAPTSGGAGGGAEVEVGIRTPGRGSHADAQPAASQTRGAADSKCLFVGKPVPCTSAEFGEWFAAQQCWIRRVAPQPAKSDPIWDDRTDGAVYWCQPPSIDIGIGGGHAIWLPASATEDLIDPAVLAERAVERMNLVGARVGATPLNGGDGVVGLQTWLWVANDGPTSMGPISRTATAGSVSVTATARATQVDWDMGNGEHRRCTGAGTKWTRGYGAKDSPTCGYTYLRDSGDQPSHAYQITATTHWRVDWEGGGQTGTITFTLEGAPLSMTVVELQAPRIL